MRLSNVEENIMKTLFVKFSLHISIIISFFHHYPSSVDQKEQIVKFLQV